MKLPSSFMKTVTGVHKEKGRIWMEQFDGLIRYCEDRWSLQMLPPFSLSYNYAAPVRFRDGSEAVLKLGVPSREFRLEAEALRMFNGRGAVRVIDADMERGIMLLERLKPGHTLDSVQDDDEAVGIAADLMRRLHVPAPAGSAFPTTVIWAEGLKRLRAHYQGGTGPLPEPLVQKAEQRFAELHATMGRPLLLHGDLHHGNILSAAREPWLAIDPKGVIGEAEYGVIPFLMNHLPEQPEVRIRRRIERFAERMELDARRIAAWAFCHTVLSAWWCVEDEAGCEQSAIRLAVLFDQLLNEYGYLT